MAGYIVLGKFTKQGAGKLKEFPGNIKAAKAAAEEMGIRHVGVWVTMGTYDIVGIIDAPDEETAAAFVLRMAQWGDVTTQTLRAFSEEEFAQVVGKLPE